MVVHLTQVETGIARLVGNMRHDQSVAAGLQNAHGLGDYKGPDLDILGALGELAVAKALGIYWGGECWTFHKADLGAHIQVRTTTKPGHSLIVRPADNASHSFVLVYATPPAFTIAGWMHGHDARTHRFWRVVAGRPGAWFVPANALNHIDTLKRT